MKKAPHKTHSRKLMTLLFTFMVFLILAFTMSVVFAATYLLIRCRAIHIPHNSSSGIVVLLVYFALASVCVGTLLTFLLSHVPLRPFNIIVHGMDRLASGDYQARIYLGEHQPLKGVADSFNTLAHELGNTEMLRSDFINSFSHEFKTPIMSIYGFAQILNRKDIPRQQASEYLQIIEEESARLSAMATNILNLTKVENQAILTDVTKFNLSEQLRTCLLLFEKKWIAHELELSADFDEFMVFANESLLKQVWINLLDNAFKFTPPKGSVAVGIQPSAFGLAISIQNSGPEISPQDQKYIFSQFYQGDTSHSSEGTGTGLAIVKKVVELHHGTVMVTSRDGKTTFLVELPAPI